jgi:hypothetical protein
LKSLVLFTYRLSSFYQWIRQIFLDAADNLIRDLTLHTYRELRQGVPVRREDEDSKSRRGAASTAPASKRHYKKRGMERSAAAADRGPGASTLIVRDFRDLRKRLRAQMWNHLGSQFGELFATNMRI